MEHFLVKLSIMLVPALLAVTVHEVSHGYAAEKLGDPTARLLGRLTLNPLRHLDPIGTLAVLIFGFGWARPVPVNFRNLRHPKRDMIWVALCGPVANFALALLSGLGLRGLTLLAVYIPARNGLAANLLEPLNLMLAFSLYINIILAVFNLVPIPPLDGGRVLAGFLPHKQAEMLGRIEPFGFLLIIALVFFTDAWQVVFGPIILHLVQIFAGHQIFWVDRAISFLFGT